MKRLVSVLFLFVSILLMSSCNTKKEYKKTFLYFDTEISITIYSSGNTDEQFKKIDETLSLYHSLTDRYNENSEIYKLNHSKEAVVSSELITLLEDVLGVDYILNDNGEPYFTIGIGALSDIWHEYFYDYSSTSDDISENSEIPSDELLNKTYNSNVEDIIINKDASKVTLNNELSLDLGGVVKGYVTRLLIEYLNSNDIDYVINMGSSTITTNIGNPKRANNTYIVGLTNPNITSSNYTGSNIYGKIKLPLNKTISTSGDYQKYILYNDRIYSSILDPYTNTSVNTDIRSISVLSSDALLGDILSTTLFMMGSAKAIEYANNNNLDIIIYKNNDEIVMTEGMRKYYSA